MNKIDTTNWTEEMKEAYKQNLSKLEFQKELEKLFSENDVSEIS